MEKEPFFGVRWSSTGAPMAPPEQLPPQCFFSLNWGPQQLHMSQDAHFESALSSLVSSPTSNPLTSAGDSVVITELIGRLGSICNSGDVSPTSRYRSANTSCYSTPLNSPPRFNNSMVERLQNRANGSPTLPNPTPNGQLFAPFAADPAFAERAAMYSCFGGRSYGNLAAQFGLPEAGKLSRVSSNQYLSAFGGASQLAVLGGDGMEIPAKDAVQLEMEMGSKLGYRTPGASTPEETEFSSGVEESSAASDKIAARDGDASLRVDSDSTTRKRKAVPKRKAKEAPLASSTSIPTKANEGDNSDSKRCKPPDTNGPEKDAAGKIKADEAGDSTQKQGKDNNAKPPEPPKDYIHVRARRGQATDSHSLAERVRREKISERMKFLQDLVPGCNKVTGKAVMLDEIINYVQSLQRQVEFLSMKVATVNPQLEFNVETVLPKEMLDSQGQLPQPAYPVESAAMPFPFSQQSQDNHIQNVMHTRMDRRHSLGPQEPSLQRSLSMQLPSRNAFDGSSQLPSFWEDDLQCVVRMGFGQSQENDFSSQNLEGQLPAIHMKNEL